MLFDWCTIEEMPQSSRPIFKDGYEEQQWCQRRHAMWVDIIGEEYILMSKNEKRHAKERFFGRTGIAPHELTTENYKEKLNMSFYCCEAKATIPADIELSIEKLQKMKRDMMDAIMYPPVVEWNTTTVAKKGNNTMYTTQTYTNEPSARSHLQSRLYDTREKKNVDLRRFFGLMDDEAPETAEDTIQRIKDGKYILRPASDYYRTFRDRIRWRDPAKQEDEAGYEAAWEVLNKDFQDANDIITVLDVKDGLSALKQFESKTYH